MFNDALSVIEKYPPGEFTWRYCRPGMDGADCDDPARVLYFCGMEQCSFRLEGTADGIAY